MNFVLLHIGKSGRRLSRIAMADILQWTVLPLRGGSWICHAEDLTNRVLVRLILQTHR